MLTRLDLHVKVPQVVLLCVSLLSHGLIFEVHAAEDNGLTVGPTLPKHVQANSPTGDWREKAQRPAVAPSAGMLFESKSWAPASAPPKGEPQLPLFPYHYMGRVQLPGRPDTVYLTKGDRVYSAVVGDLIEGTYRVVEITSDRLEVIYLPLARKQQITLSAIVPPAQPQATAPQVSSPAAPSASPAGVLSSTVQPSRVDAERNAQGAITAPASRPPGYGPSPIVISPFNTGTQSSAPTSAPMPTTAPTVQAMPIAPPLAGGMIISPPTTTTMPILAPAEGR